MPLPPDFVRPGYVVHEVLSGIAPLRVYQMAADGHRQVAVAGWTSQATITDLHNEYKIRIGEENTTRGRGQDRLRGMVYQSWKDWAHKAVAVGLLHIVGHEALTTRAGTEYLQRADSRNGRLITSDRVVVALTARGHTDLDAWSSVTRAYSASLGSGPSAPAMRQTARRGSRVTPRAQPTTPHRRR